MKDKIVRSRFVWLDSGREPNLLGSESDMYTVHARRKICPCMPPRTHQTRKLVQSSWNLLQGIFWRNSLTLCHQKQVNNLKNTGAMKLLPWTCWRRVHMNIKNLMFTLILPIMKVHNFILPIMRVHMYLHFTHHSFIYFNNHSTYYILCAFRGIHL